MSISREKQDLFKNAGYRYHFDRSIYFNRETRKAFSIEFIDDNDIDELTKRIEKRRSGRGWRFYFNFGPSPQVRQELERELGI